MKHYVLLTSIASLCLVLFLAMPAMADNTSNNDCVSVQRNNGGLTNSNCNNNSNSQNQSQTQNNDQNVTITNSATVSAPVAAAALPSTGPLDIGLYSLIAGLPLGVYLRKKAQ